MLNWSKQIMQIDRYKITVPTVGSSKVTNFYTCSTSAESALNAVVAAYMPHCPPSLLKRIKTVKIYKQFIDVETKDVKKLISRLSRLKSTIDLQDGGEYYFGGATGYNIIYIDTTKTVDELDDWLYSVNHGADYVGNGLRQE